MDHLTIQTSRPTIEICSKKAMLEIKSRHTRRMNIKTVRPRMTVEKNITQLRKNWVKTGARMGQKPLAYFIQYLSDSELKKLLDPNEIIKNGSVWEEEDSLFAAHGATDSAAKKIREEMDEAAYGGMDLIQPERMKIDWTEGEVLIEWEEDFAPRITVTPHEVVIRVKGDKGVKIRVNEEKLTFKKGKKINKQV